MPFSDFTNPYQNPADIPEKYRQDINLRKLFKADGSYVRPAEDPVTMWALQILLEEYGVPLEAMELELNSDFAEGTYQSGRRYQGRADLVVYDDRYADSVGNLDIAFIMLEAMEPSKKFGGTESEGWVDHLNRLNAYMSASPSARYAILTNGYNTVIYRRDLDYPRKLEIIGDLPKYESAREAAEHSRYKVILNANEPDGIQTGLIPLTRDKFREVLGDTRSGCHSILRDNEGLQPQEAVDAMVKFLFAKWYDEQATIDLVKQTGESRAYTDKLFKADQILEEIDVYILEKLGIRLDKIIHKNHFLVTASKLLGGRFDVESISIEFNPNDYPNSSWVNLNEVATLPSSTKIPSRKPNEEYLYIGMTDVDDLFGEVNINNLLGKDIQANKPVIKGNDIVFARIEPCIYNQKIALIPSYIKEALGSTELLIARAKSNILPSFLLWLLRSELIQRQIAGKMTGTTGRRRLPNEVFASLKLPKIYLDLQKLIADQATRQRDEAKRLYVEAENLVIEAKARVKRMILGEEEVT